MNREILFRGKRVDNGEWFYGTGIVPVKHNTHDTDKWELVEKVNYDELDYFMPSYYSEEIDINTLGRYTGLTDKNGKKIFEGDKVMFDYNWTKPTEIGIITWNESNASFQIKGHIPSSSMKHLYKMKVIGNIHDGGNE